MKTQINIALIDDESLFLEGMCLLLSSINNVTIVGQATNGPDFLAMLHNLEPAVFPEIILVDLQMKPMDGFELIEILKVRYPETKVIVLSSHYKHAMFGHMIKMGVAAFLPKNASKTYLLDALRSVQQSGVFLSKEDHVMLMEYMSNKSKVNKFYIEESFSDRELEIIQLICLELTNQEIADKLYLSKRTVESHRQRIQDKIGAKNTVGIVVYAIAHKIYNPIKY